MDANQLRDLLEQLQTGRLTVDAALQHLTPRRSPTWATPAMPLWLRNGPCPPLELEAAYNHATRELRIPRNGV
jgi:hypothetical protein